MRRAGAALLAHPPSPPSQGAIAALLTYFVNPPRACGRRGACVLASADPSAPADDQWVGAALIIQCVAIIAGGLLYWMSRSAELAGGF